MLDIKLIRENPELIKEGCRKRGARVDIDRILDLDKRKRELMHKIEQLRSKQKELGSQTPLPLKKLKQIKNEIKKLEPLLKEKEEKLQELLLSLPNLPLEDVPEGKDEKENVVLRREGDLKRFDFKPKDYLTISEKLDLIDVKRAGKISGTRFGFLKKEAVLLEFALIKFTFDRLLKYGFSPIIPPVMLKPEMMEGTGHLSEKDRKEKYFIEKDQLYLAGTAEQPIAAMYANEILKEKDLPLRYLGFSTCFRREAGSYGKDTKGIFRVHQFDKIEMFSFCKPEESKQEHEFFLNLQERLMKEIDLPYQVVKICTGDMGFPAARQYDIETWIPSEGRYRETHSTSVCTDFQARRLNIRYRSKTGKLNFVHTVNGTAFAIGRTIIAIIENYQQKDGTIKIPEALQKYTGFSQIPS
ncbi:serine--tRNA ligase [bacterium]|nr:serine--tRNA ligase [bacterium]